MRFGTAVIDIVPPFPTRMHGYAVRQDTFDGCNDPLTFTAVVLEEGGRRALIGAADICTFPNDGTLPAFVERLGQAVGCSRDNIVLNASHTHGGPLIPGRSLSYRTMPGAAATDRYRDWLYERVLEAVQEASSDLREGTLWYGQGRTGLPMNRRPDRNGDVPNAPNPGGPVDDRIQVLAIRDHSGDLAALGIKLSCHPVTTGAQHLLTADFVGAWRAAASDAFGAKVRPFFLQGAGADARPRHAADGDRWRAVRHSDLPAMGREVLAETMTVLVDRGLRPVDGLTLQGRITPVSAPCEKRYVTRDQLEPLLKEEPIRERYARTCLEGLEKDGRVPDQVGFHVQTLWLNGTFAVIGLDVEPLCGLGGRVERAVAPHQALLLGYTNGCIAYTPDTVEMKRGGYETTSYLYNGWSGPLEPGVEDLFAAAVTKPGRP